MAYKALDMLLLKVQSAVGTKNDALANTEYLPCIDDFAFRYQPEFVDLNLVKDRFGPTPKVRGKSLIDVKFTMPLSPTGTSAVPSVNVPLLCSGFGYALATAKHTYTISGAYATDRKDCTMWGYTGDTTTGQTVITKGHSAMFDLELAGKLGEPVMATFSGKAIPDGQPAAGNYVAQAVTLPTANPPALLKQGTMSFGGQTVSTLSWGFKTGTKIVPIPGDNISGYVNMDISDFAPTFEVEFLQGVVGAALIDAMEDATATAFQQSWANAAGAITTIKLNTNIGQIISIEEGDYDGIKTYKASLQVNGINCSLIFNDA